jgi:hypothetical protein
MQLIQCHKCGQFDPTWDYAHVCGPVEVKPQMNLLIRELAIEAAITTNLNTDYFEKDMNRWVDYYSEKFAELIVIECASIAARNPDIRGWTLAKLLKDQFGVDQ